MRRLVLGEDNAKQINSRMMLQVSSQLESETSKAIPFEARQELYPVCPKLRDFHIKVYLSSSGHCRMNFVRKSSML